jgi:hypothetical protein
MHSPAPVNNHHVDVVALAPVVPFQEPLRAVTFLGLQGCAASNLDMQGAGAARHIR